MKTKTLISILSLIACASNLAVAQVEVPGTPQWQATFRVTDEEGNPVANANVFASYYIPPPPNETEAGSQVAGLTDTNVMVTLTAHSGPAIGCGADKEGYYSTTGIGHNFDFRNRTNGQWHPWNPTINIVMKKIGHPIPMYARRAEIEMPALDKPVGFDLVEYDWVAPYGKGKEGDIFFETHRHWVSRYDFDSTLKATFPNSGDGLHAAPASPSGGGSRMPTTAPLIGYAPEVQRELSNTPASGWRDDSKGQNYYLRVRTALDENGNVKSALYGKIYGDFTLDPINSKTTLILFTYYLNPMPNSRNVEFDPSQNLFKNLPTMQQVKDP